jgi:hypothetical protein
MRARGITSGAVARGMLLTVLAALVVVTGTEIAAAAKRKAPPAGACAISHRRLVANGATCVAACNTLGWCANMACTNGQLSQLPLPCHSPEACPATKC